MLLRRFQTLNGFRPADINFTVRLGIIRRCHICFIIRARGIIIAVVLVVEQIGIRPLLNKRISISVLLNLTCDLIGAFSGIFQLSQIFLIPDNTQILGASVAVLSSHCLRHYNFFAFLRADLNLFHSGVVNRSVFLCNCVIFGCACKENACLRLYRILRNCAGNFRFFIRSFHCLLRSSSVSQILQDTHVGMPFSIFPEYFVCFCHSVINNPGIAHSCPAFRQNKEAFGTKGHIFFRIPYIDAVSVIISGRRRANGSVCFPEKDRRPHLIIRKLILIIICTGPSYIQYGLAFVQFFICIFVSCLCRQEQRV